MVRILYVAAILISIASLSSADSIQQQVESAAEKTNKISFGEFANLSPEKQTEIFSSIISHSLGRAIVRYRINEEEGKMKVSTYVVNATELQSCIVSAFSGSDSNKTFEFYFNQMSMALTARTSTKPVYEVIDWASDLRCYFESEKLKGNWLSRPAAFFK